MRKHFLVAWVSNTANGPAQTDVFESQYDKRLLTITQENLGSRSACDEDDMIVLDVDAQRQLYRILKERLGDIE